MRWIFWLSFLTIAYTYSGYPLWLYVRSRWRPRPTRAALIFPSVSVVLAVCNEAGILRLKLRNLAQINYPPDRYEVIVVSDGSSDATDQILRSQAHERLRVFFLSQQTGKACALNCGIQESHGEIVVFTDARQMIEPDAVRALAANFADPDVGCVTGELMLDDEAAPALENGVGLYWKIEKKIREWESAGGSVVGATGALYAVRRELLVPLPAGTLLDDVYLPLHVVRQGRRVVFEPRARAWDGTAGLQREFRRKVRTLTGNYQLVQLAPWLLTRANRVRFQFVSHKLLRLLVPFALAGLLLGSTLLPGIAYKSALALQFLFYASSAFALSQLRLGITTRLGNVALAFIVLNAAAAAALFCFLVGKKGLWMPAPSSATSGETASSLPGIAGRGSGL